MGIEYADMNWRESIRRPWRQSCLWVIRLSMRGGRQRPRVGWDREMVSDVGYASVGMDALQEVRRQDMGEKT